MLSVLDRCQRQNCLFPRGIHDLMEDQTCKTVSQIIYPLLTGGNGLSWKRSEFITPQSMTEQSHSPTAIY